MILVRPEGLAQLAIPQHQSLRYPLSRFSHDCVARGNMESRQSGKLVDAERFLFPDNSNVAAPQFSNAGVQLLFAGDAAAPRQCSFASTVSQKRAASAADAPHASRAASGKAAAAKTAHLLPLCVFLCCGRRRPRFISQITGSSTEKQNQNTGCSPTFPFKLSTYRVFELRPFPLA